MGSSSRVNEKARTLERGGGIGKMGGGSGIRSTKKMENAVSRKYAFVAGTCVPSGARCTGLAKRNTSSENEIPELRPE
jgi:hypothetical protein